MNDIKLDQVGVSGMPVSSTHNAAESPAKQEQVAASTPSADVTITNHLNKLVNLLGNEEASPEESARVQATKHLIQSGQYQIDMNALSEKLLNSGLLVTGG